MSNDNVIYSGFPMILDPLLWALVAFELEGVIGLPRSGSFYFELKIIEPGRTLVPRNALVC